MIERSARGANLIQNIDPDSSDYCATVINREQRACHFHSFVTDPSVHLEYPADTFMRASSYNAELPLGDDATLVAVKRSQGGSHRVRAIDDTLYLQHTGNDCRHKEPLQDSGYFERNVHLLGTRA